MKVSRNDKCPCGSEKNTNIAVYLNQLKRMV